MGQQGVGRHGQPFGGFSVGGHDGRFGAVAFDDDFVEVAGLGGAQGSEGEVVDNEDVDGGESADLGVDVAPRLEVVKTTEPATRQAGEIVGSVDELVSKLKAAGAI